MITKTLSNYLDDASNYVAFMMIAGDIAVSKMQLGRQYMKAFEFAPYSVQEQGRSIIRKWIYEK